MWLLSCNGDALGGKRQWLRPDTLHLLGRTSGRGANGERVNYIDGKSVSRKHLQLRVGAAASKDSTILHAGSTIEAIDSSKTGSYINNAPLKQSSRTLVEGEYTLRLGSYEQTFTLQWKPVVLSFINLPKKTKASGNALAVEKEKLGATGIKLAIEYITNKTTHVVATKRNTAPGLQALVQGRWVITNSWVDALDLACKRRDTGADDAYSKLEHDLDANWPSEADHIAPSSGEPNPRPNSYLTPNPERAFVFQDFTFIFLSSRQYDTLMAVVTSGGGKALCYDLKAREGGPQEVVEFVKDVAGKKHARQFTLGQEPGPGGIVIVRIKDQDEGRSNDFMRDLDVALDQRSIEQSEFLDAILQNDASELRRQLPESTQSSARNNKEPSSSVLANDLLSGQSLSAREPAPPPRPTQDSASHRPAASMDSASDKLAAATRGRNRRVITKSRFQGFGDFDPSQVIKAASESPEPPAREPAQDSMAVQESEQGGEGQHNSAEKAPRKRRQPLGDSELEDHDKMIDSLLPAAQAMKRRKMEQALKNARNVQNAANTTIARPTVELEAAKTDKALPAEKTKKSKKDTKDPVLKVDVKAQMRARKEKEEELRRLDEESMNMTKAEVDAIQIETKVVYFSLPERPVRQSTTASGESHENWNPAWNNRKNFKRFRSNKKDKQQQREADGTQERVPEVPKAVVRLEPVPKRSQQLGDAFWLQSSRDSGKGRSRSQSQSQSQSGRTRSAEEVEDHDDPSVFRRRLQRSREEDAANISLDDALDEQPDATRSQILGSTGLRKAVGKRPATAAMGPPPKRSRVNLWTNDDDSDEDPTAFRRRARR